MTLVLAATVGVLYAAGTYLILQRTLTRIVLGLAMMGHGANILLLLAGRSGVPPLIVEGAATGDYADPLPQAMALTAIVITFGIMAFLLAMAYRSRRLTGDDAVEDDWEDRRIAGMIEGEGRHHADEREYRFVEERWEETWEPHTGPRGGGAAR